MNDAPFDRVIWTSEDAAAYLKKSKAHFLRTIRHQRGFPAPLTGDSQHPRWRAIAVSDWALGISRLDYTKAA